MSERASIDEQSARKRSVGPSDRPMADRPTVCVRSLLFSDFAASAASDVVAARRILTRYGV